MTPGHATHYFCLLCKRSSEVGEPGWQIVKASFQDGQWVKDDKSPAGIMICPECRSNLPESKPQ
jgi:hypothetical protein